MYMETNKTSMPTRLIHIYEADLIQKYDNNRHQNKDNKNHNGPRGINE